MEKIQFAMNFLKMFQEKMIGLCCYIHHSSRLEPPLHWLCVWACARASILYLRAVDVS